MNVRSDQQVIGRPPIEYLRTFSDACIIKDTQVPAAHDVPFRSSGEKKLSHFQINGRPPAARCKSQCASVWRSV